MTYRQRGNDFWPGTIDPITGNTDETTCKKYDNIYKVNRNEIIEHYDNVVAGTPTFSENISGWPGRTNLNMPSLAPFFFFFYDGVQNPIFGDYPVLQNECVSKKLFNF